MKERFCIYSLRVPAVPAGKTLFSFGGQVDSDAPFAARSWSAVNANNGAVSGDDLVLARLKGPDGMYLQNNLVPLSRLIPASTAYQWTPVYPELVYPAGGFVSLDVQNLQGAPLTGLVFLVRGVKLYPDSYVLPGASAYPERFSSYPFDLARWHTLAAGADLFNVPLNTPSDAAVVIRSVSIQVSSKLTPYADEYLDLSCILRDSDHKAYMNDYVRVQYLFDSDPSEPRPIFPQIFLPPNSVMYYDLRRGDVPSPAASFCLTFKGAKVIQR